jgi:N,N'-diacetyllegionaminate synthase
VSPFRSSRNGVYFIAEVGGNHEGNFEYALRLSRLAAESGADAVKHQVYTGDTLVSDRESPERNRHFKRFELSQNQYRELARIVRANGAEWLASVWNLEAVGWVDSEVRMHKVGSGDLTCYPMLVALACTGKPIILSTGLATLGEVAGAIDVIAQVDETYISDSKIALLHCTSAYPCPDEDTNLAAMVVLKERFKLPTGYSDHTIGTVAVEAAVALGAQIIEKHFTDSREGKSFRDHQVSLTADEVRSLLTRVRAIRAMIGHGRKEPSAAEITQGHLQSFRRSIYAARALQAGETLTAENVVYLRPEHGIPASRYREALGRRVRRLIERHEPIQECDLDEAVGEP